MVVYGFRGMETESISEVLYFGTRRPFHFEGVETLGTAITDMSACSVNYWQSKFVQMFLSTGLNRKMKHCKGKVTRE